MKKNPFNNLFHRITILTHKFQIWILPVWSNNHFDKTSFAIFRNLSIHLSQFLQLVLISLATYKGNSPITQ